MRIKSKWLKKQRHSRRIKLPLTIKKRFKKEIANGDVPTAQQIRSAIELGVVIKDSNGKPDHKSLANYFKTFIQQRRADDQRKLKKI